MTSFTWKPFCFTCYLCSLGLAWTVCSSSGVCCTCVVAPFCSAYARAWLVLLVAFTVLSTFLVALGELARIALFCGVRAFSLHRMLLYRSGGFHCCARCLACVACFRYFVLLLTLFSLLAFLGSWLSFRCLLCLHWLPGLL